MSWAHLNLTFRMNISKDEQKESVMTILFATVGHFALPNVRLQELRAAVVGTNVGEWSFQIQIERL